LLSGNFHSQNANSFSINMRFTVIRGFVVLLTVALVSPDFAHAQDVTKLDCRPSVGKDRLRQFGFLYDNDFFASSDRNYTSGALFSLTTGSYEAAGNDPCRSDLSRQIAIRINGLIDHSLPERNFVFAVGQQLYTPSLRLRTSVQPNDRPFAGWLFGRWALHAFDTHRSQTLSLDIGVVGPAAGGEASQNFFHGLQGYSRFRGWGNQLSNEIGVLVASESRHEILQGSRVSLIGHYGGGVGNVETYINTGLKLRFGANGFHDYRTPTSMRSASAISQTNAGSEAPNRGLQGFVGVDFRAVAHNIFLDGNTWTQSHSVRKRPGVADLSAGLSWSWVGLDFAYTHTYRSREFYGQSYTHAFGGLSIAKTLP
jgi:lipid A 3-O-deacylase